MTALPPPPDPEATAAVAGAIVAASIGPAAFWQHVDLGAPTNVLFAILVGAGAGVLNTRIRKRGNLVGMFLMAFVLTLVVVVGLPHATGYPWPSAGFQAAMALGLSFTAQNWGPKAMSALSKLDFIEILKTLLRNWINPRSDKDGR